MTASDQDEAVLLAELFKKQGYLDKLKNEIITKHITNPNDATKSITFEDAVKEEVKRTVRSMVENDENLIFKNRGTTTALIETRISKDDYQLLRGEASGIDIHNFVKENIQNTDVSEGVLRTLTDLMEKKENGN